jgi:hypothetical protein
LTIQHAITSKFIPNAKPNPAHKLSKFSSKALDTTESSHSLLPEHHTIQGSYQAARNQILENINFRTAELLNV